MDEAARSREAAPRKISLLRLPALRAGGDVLTANTSLKIKDARRSRRGVMLLAAFLVAPHDARAHSGPPYPIVTDRLIGPYSVALWADPDVTDDGTPAGQFWVVVQTADKTAKVPVETRADVTIRPTDRTGDIRRGRTQPVSGDPSRQFIALLMDHEGPFAVHVAIHGPLGSAELDSNVDATYDLRPSRGLMIVFLMPFLLVGFIWGKLLLQRRRGRPRFARPAAGLVSRPPDEHRDRVAPGSHQSHP